MAHLINEGDNSWLLSIYNHNAVRQINNNDHIVRTFLLNFCTPLMVLSLINKVDNLIMFNEIDIIDWRIFEVFSPQKRTEQKMQCFEKLKIIVYPQPRNADVKCETKSRKTENCVGCKCGSAANERLTISLAAIHSLHVKRMYSSLFRTCVCVPLNSVHSYSFHCVKTNGTSTLDQNE